MTFDEWAKKNPLWTLGGKDGAVMTPNYKSCLEYARAAWNGALEAVMEHAREAPPPE
jgi:hypothetical protein